MQEGLDSATITLPILIPGVNSDNPGVVVQCESRDPSVNDYLSHNLFEFNSTEEKMIWPEAGRDSTNFYSNSIRRTVYIANGLQDGLFTDSRNESTSRTGEHARCEGVLIARYCQRRRRTQTIVTLAECRR